MNAASGKKKLMRFVIRVKTLCVLWYILVRVLVLIAVVHVLPAREQVAGVQKNIKRRTNGKKKM